MTAESHARVAPLDRVFHQVGPFEFLDTTGHTQRGHTAGCQSKWATNELLAEDAIFLTEILDQIFLVPVQPASDSKDKEVQRIRHPARPPGISRTMLTTGGLSSA